MNKENIKINKNVINDDIGSICCKNYASKQKLSEFYNQNSRYLLFIFIYVNNNE